MPESITPVGAMIQPPSLQSGLNTLSSLYGIQQQRVGLQQQQQQLAKETAGAQQAQQENTEKQALATFTKNAAQDPSYLNADGSPNVQKYQTDAMKVAPVYGQQYIGQMTSNFNGAVENRKALLGLSNEQRATIGNYLGAVAAKPRATEDDLKDAIELARSVSPDRGYQRAIDDFLLSMPHTEGMPTDQASAAIRQGARAAAVGANSVSAGQSAPAMTGVNTLSGVQQIQTNPQSPLGMGPQGGPVAGSSLPAIAGASAREVQTGGADVDRANEVGALQQPSSAGLDLTKQVDRLAEDIGSGKVAKMISETGNYFGMSSINQARSQLNKDLGQLRGAVAGRAGSDARAAEILEGYPTDTTPTQTIHAAMDYVRGTFRQNLARGSVLAQYQRSDPQGLRGFQAADNLLSGQTSPLMHEFLSLPPDQRAGFYKRNFGTPQEAQAFKDQVTALQKHTSVLGAQ